MNTQETKSFLAGIAPFDRLGEQELARLAESVSPAPYGARQTIVQRWERPDHLYVIASGSVEEVGSAGVVGRLGAGELFDSQALIEGRSQHSFVGADPSTCLLLPIPLLRALSQSNPEIRNFFARDAARRTDALVALQQQQEAASLLMARIGAGSFRPPVFVDPGMSINQAVASMKEHGTSALLVRDGERVGIFTGRDVREKLVLMEMAGTTPVGTLATYDLICLEADDSILDALVVMTKKVIRHVVITREGEIIGVLEQADLLGSLTNTSYAIANQAERADDQESLREASEGVPRLIRSLHDRGLKPRYIARVVTDLNRKIFHRLFEQLAPPALADQACLIVMGSEGRGEQLLRTDQDNGMVFAGETAPGGFFDVAAAFPAALTDLGYPPCPGGVMASNPQWAKSAAAYREDLLGWIHQPSADGFMNLAIFFDGEAVAGDEGLLKDLKAYLFELVRGQSNAVRHFARAVQSFDTPIGWFNRLVVEKKEHQGELDIKKGGIFPIVHAARSLALEHGLTETNTIARLQALAGRRPFGRELTADLIEAFDFMSMLRLRAQLDQQDRGIGTSNYVRPSSLNRLERGLLRDSLKVVKQLKSLIASHYRLDALS